MVWLHGYHSLVAGNTGYVLQITCTNGGVFLPSTASNPVLTAVGDLQPIYVATDSTGSYSVLGPSLYFTPWVESLGGCCNGDPGTGTNSATDAYGAYTITGTLTIDAWGYVFVPFSFNAPIQTAKIGYSSNIDDYGNNFGAARIDLFKADGTQYELYCEKADSTDPTFADYNYTASETPVPGVTIVTNPSTHESGRFNGYTDFSAIVAGETYFSLRFSVGTGWDWPVFKSGFFPFDTRLGIYNDFTLSGTLGQSVPVTSLQNAKSQPDNSLVSVNGEVVTAAYGGYFYIETADRTSGIRVNWAGVGPGIGTTPTVFGTITTNPTSGERYIQASWVAPGESASIQPLGMNNKAIGGAALGLQQGVNKGVGLNNIGLLVKTWGSFSYDQSGNAYVNDGSGLNIQFELPSGTFSEQYAFGSITGVVSCQMVGSAVQPVILLRTASDLSGDE